MFLKAALTTSYRAFACQNPPARVAPVGEAFSTFWDSDNFLSLYKVQSDQILRNSRITGEITILPLPAVISQRSHTTRLFSILVLLAPGLLSSPLNMVITDHIVMKVNQHAFHAFRNIWISCPSFKLHWGSEQGNC